MSELVDFLAAAGFDEDMSNLTTVHIAETPPKRSSAQAGSAPAGSAPAAPNAPAALSELPMGHLSVSRAAPPAEPSDKSSAVGSLLAAGKLALIERAKLTKEDIMCSQIHIKGVCHGVPNC
jgi:hypothetical protein